jgi:hypothetical protein
MSLPFATAWHLVAAAADANAMALSTGGSGVTSVDTSDPLGVGRRVTFPQSNPASQGLFPLLESVGAEWALQLFMLGSSGSSFNDGPVCALESSSAQRTVHFNRSSAGGSNNVLRVMNGATVVHTFDNHFFGSERHYAIEVVEHASAGIIRVYVDGSLVATYTGLNTSRAFAFDRIRLGGGSANAGNFTCTHVIVRNEAVAPGDTAQVDYHPFDTDVSPNQFTRSNGGIPHWDHLDDVPHDGNTTYLVSATAGEKTRHRAAAATLPAGRQVLGVRAVYTPRLEDAGGDRLQITSESGAGAPVVDVVANLTTSFKPHQGGEFMEANPDGDVPWTQAALQALEIEAEHLDAP